MKRGIIFLTLGITLIALATLFFQSFSPLNLEKIQELVIQNDIQPGENDKLIDTLLDLRSTGKLVEYLNGDFYIGIFIGLIGIFLVFNTIHLTVDKLFFKNFYQKASFFDSIRRGSLFIISLFLMVMLGLSGYLFNDLLLGLVVILLIEVLFTLYFRESFLKFLQKTYKKPDIDSV